MKELWNKLSTLARYYIVCLGGLFLFWGVLLLIKVEFVNILFFMTAYVWHFTVQTPGLKEKMLLQKQKYSFLNIIVRINYYLQLFIKIEKFKFGTSIVRAISPFLFTTLLLLAGGSGNIFFTLTGSFCFEAVYFLLYKESVKVVIKELEIPPEIPREENCSE